MAQTGNAARSTKRNVSQAETRAKLLLAARKLFARDGYSVTSLDRIALEAGFSKGAIYSNFKSKSEVFHAVLESQGEASLPPLLDAIRNGESELDVIDAVARWADESARDGNWPMLVLDHARRGGDRLRFDEPEESFFRFNWRMLGKALLDRFPRPDIAPEELGGVVFALIYAPAMTFVSRPTSGDLVRVALRAMLVPP